MSKQFIILIIGLISIIPTVAGSVSLGHVLVATTLHGFHDVVYEKKHGDAVVEDDIILKPLSILNPPGTTPPHALILLRLGGAPWPKGIIPFTFDPNLPLETKLAALDAMNIWQMNTRVTFVELTDGNHEIYPNYVVFTPVGDNQCSSYVGQQGGAQPIKLSLRCNSMRTTHELGHTLGLWHEQSRADRDNYIRIVWENISEDYRYNFSQHLSDGIDFGDYDYQSIMHYTSYAFSNNGEKTIIPLQENVDIGQRDHLSKKDIAAINSMYPEQS